MPLYKGRKNHFKATRYQDALKYLTAETWHLNFQNQANDEMLGKCEDMTEPNRNNLMDDDYDASEPGYVPMKKLNIMWQNQN